LLSPWVDLMHSFPSICGSAELDYIPGDGFMHKPSMGWPPPSLEDVHDELVPSGAAALKTSTNGAIGFSVDDARKADTKVPAKDRERGYSVTDPAKMPKSESSNRDKRAQENGPDMLQSNITEQPEPSSHLPAVMVDGQLVQIRDQIQLYSPNHLLQHPLVSPVLQPSLGGLPPILIQIGGGELLRDEQVYLAHKMANPSAYPPRKEILNRYDPDRTAIDKYKPTNVQVQLWEDMCHVGHTLSFTRPAKFMYRSVAQFGAWALAHAQGRSIDIPIDDQSDTDSVSSQEESDEGKKSPIADASATIPTIKTPANGTVGKAGDPLPPFVNNMIRQRVDRHGDIYDLPPIEDIPVLHIDPEEIGILKEGPVKKWLQRQQKWNKKFATTKRELQKKRAKQLAKGYVGLPQGEKPPPTALAGMRTKDLPKVGRVTTSWGMMMWSGWGSKHDEVRVSSKLHFRGFMFSGTYYENLILRLHCIALLLDRQVKHNG
jgi:acetyl esterase/lipase